MRFVEYLNEREDGLFPAVYFVDEGLSVCVGENGERGSMKPVFVYVSLGALACMVLFGVVVLNV